MLCHSFCSSPPPSLLGTYMQDAPYLDLAPYMPEYYKPQYLLDFEDRLPSSVQGSDSLSLNSFNSVTSTNLEWDDSAIAPSSEGKRCGEEPGLEQVYGGSGRKPRLCAGTLPGSSHVPGAVALYERPLGYNFMESRSQPCPSSLGSCQASASLRGKGLCEESAGLPWLAWTKGRQTFSWPEQGHWWADRKRLEFMMR